MSLHNDVASVVIFLCTFTGSIVGIFAANNDSSTCEVKGWNDLHDSDRARVLESILAENWKDIDPFLPGCLQSLRERGAHRCWHKHSTFLQHLVGVTAILHLWGQGATIGRVGLFHSAYSNSYVNLALYDPATERSNMEALVGTEAEDLVHLFCVIDRQKVVVDTLLRNGFIPSDGLEVPHLRHSNQSVFLDANTLRLLVVFTMADIADQYFGWQDELFGGGGSKGSMIILGQDIENNHDPMAIWPGVSKPGLWMSYVSQLGQVAHTVRSHVPVPPVFANCSLVLSLQDETIARDLYWEVVIGSKSVTQSIQKLLVCRTKNPFAFEPLVLLTQLLLHQNRFEEASNLALRALELQLQWGTAWDKRLSFGAWVAWTRVLHQRAEERQPWPSNSWDVNNFGLVR